MDWFTETPYWPPMAPLLLWIKVLEICALVLLALAMLTFLVGWLQHRSWRIGLWALLSLVASGGAAIAAHALHSTYAFWVTEFHHSVPLSIYSYAQYAIGNATHTATLLGWACVLVTGLLLSLSLVGLWRLCPRRPARAS